MDKLRVFLIVLLAALMMAACSPGTSASGGNPTGVDWKLVAINGQPVLAGTSVTLGLTDGQAGGTGGCNNYGGAYQIQGSKLTFGDLAMTEMACMDPAGVMEQETLYLQTLSQTASFALAGDRLELKNAAGETILVFGK